MIAELISRSEPTLSFEFFPPKDEIGEDVLWRSFDSLLELSPDFVSVTYGAGGSNQSKSLAVLGKMAVRIPTIGHLTCVGATFASTRATIGAFEDAGVAAILAIRGDAPNNNPDALAQGELKTALELVEQVHELSDMEVGVAAFPEIHPESADMSQDVKVLKLKQDAGAKYAFTQLFFKVDAYTELVAAARASGVTIPIVPGVMPIANSKGVLRMAELSGAEVPAALVAELEAATDDELARDIGMAYSIKFAKDLLAAGAPGLHIFSLNHHRAAEELARGAFSRLSR
ncbi:MAG: methylenetetrahydrofolate reductase [Rhodoluna sp.]|nr:methylenetetrahydrofolate reductase [Rhodoluna sp.]